MLATESQAQTPVAQDGQQERAKKAKLPAFIWLVLISYGLNIVVNIVVMVFITKYSFVTNEIWASFVEMALQAATFWLILERKSHTREAVIAMSAIGIVLATVSTIINDYGIASAIFYWVIKVAVILYMVFSKKAKEIFVQPWNMSNYRARIDEHKGYFRPNRWPFWRNVVIYFCLFSILGHAMELGMCSLVRAGLLPGTYDPNSMTWTTVMNPFLIYGSAFVLIALVLSPLKVLIHNKMPDRRILPYVVSYVVNTLVCTVIELIVGLTTNASLQYWDYSTMPFNFMGQICLLYALFFGILSSFMCWIVYPALEKLLARVPRDVMNVVFVFAVFFFAVLLTTFNVTVDLGIGL